jgi:hypothetical protein
MTAPPTGLDSVRGPGPSKRDVLLALINVVGLHLDSADGPASRDVVVQIIDSYHQEVRVSNDKYDVHQAGAVGPGAHAHDMTFVSNQMQLPPNIDLPVLVSELQRVRRAMQDEADAPEQYLALAEIGLAEKAAADKDGSKVMAHLAKAGKWALKVATEIGTKVAAEVITHAGGF